MSWKSIASKIIFKNNFFTLKSEKCQLPDNRIFENYYLFECRDWVQIIAKDENNEFIMVEQYRHGGKKTFLEFPGGVIDQDEAPEIAAKREMLEETGHEVSDLDYLGFQYPNPALQENKIHIFYARESKLVGEQSLDEFEDVTIKKVTQHILENLVERGGHHSLMLATYFVYKNYLSSNKAE